MRRTVAAAAVLTLLTLSACSANSDPSSSGDKTTTTGKAGEPPTGPSPGVTDDTIKIGIPYINLEPLKEIVDLDQGDYEASYQAVIDQVNDAGGIHGRMLEPIYAPISPIGPTDADEACVKLTEDDDVFVVIGYLQDDAVLCPLADHATATIGGLTTEARNDQAQAPWFALEPGEDESVEAVKVMAEAGELDGKLGVFATNRSDEAMNDVYLPLLEELGIEPVDTAVLDAPDDDANAQNQAVQVVAERFESQGIDQVLTIGDAALNFANGITPLDYRPEIRSPNAQGLGAYAYGANPDFSIIEPALAAGAKNGTFEEENMQKCLETLVDAGVEKEYKNPEDIPLGEPTPFNSALAACRDIGLLQAILEEAGPDLNYGTFQQAGESLQDLTLPGATDPYNYGPFPSNDGDLPMYLTEFSKELNYFVPVED